MNINRLLSEEKGAVTIVEAAFVFPIMFFIVFFMIMAGEAYYQYARVENTVTFYAVSAAARCENPMLEYVQKHGNTVPKDPNATQVVPYRYILTGEAKKIANQADSDMRKSIKSMKPLLFRGMNPQIRSTSVKAKLNLLVSSVSARCDFEVALPIRMIFTNDTLKFRYSIEVVEPVGDPAELIRNVSVVSDYFIERHEGVSKFVKEFKEKANKIGVYVN